jgi:hypothetical protein
MSGDDGMDSYIWVPAARHVWSMWPCPVMLGSKCHCLPRPRHMAKSMRYWKLLDGAIGCPGPSQVREGGRSGKKLVKSCLPTSIVMRKRDSVECSRFQFFLGWWPHLFSQEWWGHIWYGVYGSPSICYWREPVVSRILACNRRLAVPGY